MKWTKMTWLLLAFFMFSVFSPIKYAAAEPIDEIVIQMQEICGYMSDYDKNNIIAARTALQGFSTTGTNDDWDTILGVGTDNNLLTTQVIERFGDEATARAQAKALFTSMGGIYYTTDPTELESRLFNFKETYKTHFGILFGTDITMDDLYQLMSDSRKQLPLVISETEAGLLATGSNADLINKMPEYLVRAMNSALALPANQTFSGRLVAIGWSTDKLIAQQKELAAIIDSSGSAQLSLALAAVRSETTLFAGPTTLQVGDKPLDQYIISIMNRNASAMVAWDSANQNIVAVSTDPITGNFIIEAKAPGTTQLIVYRDYTGGTAANDWLLKFDVTVEGAGVLYGDVNNDNEINIADAVMILKHITDGVTLTGNQLVAADVDGVPSINIADAVQVLKKITDSNYVFPIEL